MHSIPLVPRSHVRLTSAYLTVHPDPNVHVQELATIPENGWQRDLVASEQAVYVEAGLLDILAAAAMNNEGAAQLQRAPLAEDVEAVDTWGEYVAVSQLPPQLSPPSIATSPLPLRSSWWSALLAAFFTLVASIFYPSHVPQLPLEFLVIPPVAAQYLPTITLPPTYAEEQLAKDTMASTFEVVQW